eukprot:7363508-Karenia_brevis.AAC.1
MPWMISREEADGYSMSTHENQLYMACLILMNSWKKNPIMPGVEALVFKRKELPNELIVNEIHQTLPLGCFSLIRGRKRTFGAFAIMQASMDLKIENIHETWLTL